MLEQLEAHNKLKEVLKNNGMKQIYVAEQIGASKYDISRFVSGKAALPFKKYQALLEWLKKYN